MINRLAQHPPYHFHAPLKLPRRVNRLNTRMLWLGAISLLLWSGVGERFWPGVWHHPPGMAIAQPVPETTASVTFPTAIRGVEAIAPQDNHTFKVISSTGIGVLAVQLQPGEAIAIDLFYEAERPLPELEGLAIATTPDGDPLDIDTLIATGQLRLTGSRLDICADTEPIDWTIQFIDFYR